MAKTEQTTNKAEAGDSPATAGAQQQPPGAEAAVSELDLTFRDEIAGHPGGENIRRCYACGTCAAGCPITEIDSQYNCRRIIRQILFGMRDEVLSSPLIWMCLVCYRCYVRCPQKVNFTDIMRVLRYLAVKEKRVSPAVFERIGQLDRCAQSLRHELVASFFEKEDMSLEELEGRVGKVLKEALK